MSTHFRPLLKDTVLVLHKLFLPLGLIVLPKRYSVPFPDIRRLSSNRSRWTKKSELRGIAVDLDEQSRTMCSMLKCYLEEYRTNEAYKRAVQQSCGLGFGRLEAMALHGVVRAFKPARIVEIGSGTSTFCMLSALEKNVQEGKPGHITSIEPYPRKWLKQADVTLIAQQVQEVDLAVFDELGHGDLLFVDSTHTVQADGDVNKIILDILPRLRSGVIVHFHDIYFPYDYNREVLRSVFHWMETAMLHAFLIGNQRFEILFCMSLLHYERPAALRVCFPDYQPKADSNGLDTGTEGGDFPSSIYLRVV